MTNTSTPSYVHFGFLGTSGIRHVISHTVNNLLAYGRQSSVVAFQRQPLTEDVEQLFSNALSVTAVVKARKFDVPAYLEVFRQIKSVPPGAIAVHHDPSVALLHSILWRLRGKSISTPVLVHHSAFNYTTLAYRLIGIAAGLLVSRNVAVGRNTVPLKARIARMEQKTELIPNPVSLPMPHKSNRSSQDEFKITMVGRMVHQKDFATLVRAFMLASALNPNLRLHIAGAGPERAMLQQLIRRAPNKITFHGELSPAQTLSLISDSDLYVQSTRGEADLSTSVLQAMAFRVPVVWSGAPGIIDEIATANTLLAVPLFEVGHVRQLAEILQHTATEPDRAVAIAESCHIYVSSVHGPEANAKRWLVLSEELWRNSAS